MYVSMNLSNIYILYCLFLLNSVILKPCLLPLRTQRSVTSSWRLIQSLQCYMFLCIDCKIYANGLVVRDPNL